MSGQPDRQPPRSRNLEVVGTFESSEAAESAARELRDAGLEAQIGGTAARRISMEGEMAEETSSAVMGPGSVGPFTKAMSRGALLGTLTGTAIGVVVGAIATFLLPIEWGLSDMGTALIGAASGGFAGATAGFIWGGFRSRAEGEGEQLAAERGVTVSVSAGTDGSTAARILRRHDPLRVDALDDAGRLVADEGGEDERPVRGEHRAGKPDA